MYMSSAIGGISRNIQGIFVNIISINTAIFAKI